MIPPWRPRRESRPVARPEWEIVAQRFCGDAPDVDGVNVRRLTTDADLPFDPAALEVHRRLFSGEPIAWRVTLTSDGSPQVERFDVE